MSNNDKDAMSNKEEEKGPKPKHDPAYYQEKLGLPKNPAKDDVVIRGLISLFDKVDVTNVLDVCIDVVGVIMNGIVRITDTFNCGFKKTDDPHGFTFGGQFWIFSCLRAAQDGARWFALNIEPPKMLDLTWELTCPECGVGSDFDTWMDTKYHRSTGCSFETRSSDLLPPIQERQCNFASYGWCIPDTVLEMLKRTDFQALGLPPQKLIDTRRKPLEFNASIDLDDTEYRAIRDASSTLLTVAASVCDDESIVNVGVKKPFLAFLPFFKDLPQWSPELKRLVQVREIKRIWPKSISDFVSKRKSEEELARERNRANEAARKEKSARELERPKKRMMTEAAQKARKKKRSDEKTDKKARKQAATAAKQAKMREMIAQDEARRAQQLRR